MDAITETLKPLDGKIYDEVFEGDVKTSSIYNAPEFVQAIVTSRARKT